MNQIQYAEQSVFVQIGNPIGKRSGTKMFSRSKFSVLEDSLDEIGIDLKEFMDETGYAIGLINSASRISTYKDSVLKIIKAEEIILNLIHDMITELNPDMNPII